MNAEVPDITVAVDLGTTYTGVAWMTPRTPVQVISDWPGSGDRNERKVPTTLIYHGNGVVSSWGFMCADDDTTMQGKSKHEFFKIFMEADTLAGAQQQGLSGAPASTLEAQRFCTDYLRQVYLHVKDSIESEIGRRDLGGWSGMRVEFVFSVPTTWTSLSVINTFRDVIRNAGFGVEGPRHSAEIDLTEAEAAAVATLKTSAVTLGTGTVFLTVDAGGGTTDLALMQVTSANQQIPQISSMHPVSGVGIGASVIDRLFIHLVSQRMATYPDIIAALPPDLPTRLARSHHFRTLKHKFGERAYMQPVFRIPMEGVAHHFSHAGVGIENGRMIFSIQEIQALFDQQIEGIAKKITEELDWLRDSGRPEQVQHMVLSGGLGSSAYVRDQLQQRFASFSHPNSNPVEVIRCSDPQLVVVRGLLLDRQQKAQTGGTASVLAARVARASYGVIVRQPYLPGIHLNEDIVPDLYETNKKWAMNQIEWLIKKGDVIYPNAPLAKLFQVRLAAGELTRAWDTEVVTSHSEPSLLPKSMKKAGATKICDVRSNLDGVSQEQLILKHKRRSCFSRGYTFYICEYEVRVIVAPADLRFELWLGGQKFSGNHEPIAVTWDDEGIKAKS
ncbi:Chaperone protein HscA [Madurella mycetomatis]|uniref:Chaperone protein HscA n=1 Tax=Madurella mycetomatis TaxID=100816 RepID=A0A175WAU6_9PEZI|nr:Chaperone protein HscA [Madurella mycetomatis]